jgi:hypothetical protein
MGTNITPKSRRNARQMQPRQARLMSRACVRDDCTCTVVSRVCQLPTGVHACDDKRADDTRLTAANARVCADGVVMHGCALAQARRRMRLHAVGLRRQQLRIMQCAIKTNEQNRTEQKGYTLAKGKRANRRKPPLALLRRGAGDS